MSEVIPILKFLDAHHQFIIEATADIASGVAALVPGLEEFALPIQAGKVGVQLSYDKLHGMAEEAMGTVKEAEAIYGKGSKVVNDVKHKVALINSTIEQHKSTMSNKQIKPSSFHSPGKMPRQNRVATLTTRPRKSALGKSALEFSMSSSKTPVTSSSLTANHSYFDSHLIEGPSEKSLTTLNVKIGKQLYPDVITPFLKNLSGSGKIRMQFAGRLMCKSNERHTHMQVFRHRLSDDTTSTPGSWPTGTVGTADYILGPDNTVIFKVDGAGPSTVQTGFPIGTTSFRDILNQSTYWAPYNKADLEDLSWNLNSLKLNNPLWDPATPVPTGVGFETNVPLFEANMHARQSAIAANNREAVDLPPSSTTRTGNYRYNAVFNKGSVEYDFMNKGGGGAKVELIIYRMKKDQTLTTNGSSHGNNPKLLNEKIANAIGAGYLETCVEKGGTDALKGRPPLYTDVSENPAFPFLPTLKKTIGSDMWFVEVSRQTFAMPSGSRRSVNIQLPGEVYDPVNIKAVTSSTPSAATYPPIIDNGSYCIMISVSGAKCTNEASIKTIVAGNPKGHYNIGDIFSAANIQFYATYTEHMGACQYKAEKTANIYTQGGLLQPSPPTNYQYTPVTMLPTDSAVRVGVPPGSAVGLGQSNLLPHFDAEPLS